MSVRCVGSKKSLYIVLIALIITILMPVVVYAADGFVAYRSQNGSGLTFPKVRYWNSTLGSYSAEVELPAAGSVIRFASLKASPVGYKLVLLTQSDDGFMDGYVCYVNCTVASNWVVSNNFAIPGSLTAARRFDFEFEPATGDAVIVYSAVNSNVNNDLSYRVLSAGSVNLSDTTELYINDAGHATDLNYTWISLDRSPNSSSSEIVLTGFDSTSSDINAWVWDGSNWTNEISLATAATATAGSEALAVKYVSNGSIAMVLTGNGVNGVANYAYWNSTNGTWSNVTSFDTDTADTNDVRFITLKADPSTNNLQGTFVDTGSDLTTAFWNNTNRSWTITTNIDTGLDTAATRGADFAWMPTGSTGRLVWDTDGAAGTTLSQRTCSPYCSGATSTTSAYAGTGGWITLFRNIDNSNPIKILGIRFNSTFRLGSFSFNGSIYSNYGDAALTLDNSTLYESYSMDFIRSSFLPIIIMFENPTDANNSFVARNYSEVNLTVSNPAASCRLNWSGTIYNMTGSYTNRQFNVTGLSTGSYSYYSTCNISANVTTTSSRILDVDVDPINITLLPPTPDNDTIYSNFTVMINISTNKNVSSCTLNLSDTLYNMSGSNSSWSIQLTPLNEGSYEQTVYCTDYADIVGYSQTIFFVIAIPDTDGFISYRSPAGSGLNFPKIRFWNSSNNGSYSAEIELSTAGSPVRMTVIKASPRTYKFVLVTISNDGLMDGYVCYVNCTAASSWIVANNFATSIVSTPRRFDLEFESATGDALIVYSVNSTNTSRDIGYRVLDDVNSNLSDTNESYINDVGQANDIIYSWIAVDRNPDENSSDIGLIGFDFTSNDINAWIWNGTNWTSELSIATAATSVGGFEGLAIKYVSNGSAALAVGADGANGNVNYALWNTTNRTWSNITIVDTDATDTNDVRFITLKADPGSSNIQGVFIDSGSDLNTGFWNTTSRSWTMTSNIDTGIDVITSRIADFAWLPSGLNGRLVWDTDAAGTVINYRVCTPSCTGATLSASTYGGTGGWMTLFRVTNNDNIVKLLGVRLNSAFNIGSFLFNGSNFTNYGDTAIATGDTITTYENYGLDWIKSLDDGVIINFVRPSENDGAVVARTHAYVNVTVYPTDVSCTLDWEGVSYDMAGSGTYRFYNKTGVFAGINSYFVTCNNSILSGTTASRILIANTSTSMNISLMFPANNSVNASTSIIFSFNATTNPVVDIINCSLIANGDILNITTATPVNQTQQINITGTLISGNYNWSVMCIDENGGAEISFSRNLSVRIPPIIYNISVNDLQAPDNELILSPGDRRKIYCNAVVSDPYGPENVFNASATFYYYLNLSSHQDNNNVHYSNTSCALNETTSFNKTFSCVFDVLYYANNGTWNCNVTVFNNQSVAISGNGSGIIAPLYAVNVTDGMAFGAAESSIPSTTITVNMTNFGNMPLNITVQGYAAFIGDNVGMNCSDQTNITITNIKFSTNVSDTFNQKTSLNGSVQRLSVRVLKQNTTTPSTNITYWQISPNPGTINRICGGNVIFSAEAP